MPYQCGFGAGIPGLPAREPHFLCDGCGVKRSVVDRLGMQTNWMLNGKPPPKWRRDADRRTYCHSCKHDVPVPNPEDTP